MARDLNKRPFILINSKHNPTGAPSFACFSEAKPQAAASFAMTPLTHLGLSLVGGCLIGLASFVASASTGKIPGLSGVLSRSLHGQPGDKLWRVVMLIGLVIGAGLVFVLAGPALPYRPINGVGVTVLAGVLVGFGTRIGGGCTSGQGVCGIGLGARDALIATVVFMGAAMITVYLVRHGIGIP